jgi:hypothetical protein
MTRSPRFFAALALAAVAFGAAPAPAAAQCWGVCVRAGVFMPSPRRVYVGTPYYPPTTTVYVAPPPPTTVYVAPQPAPAPPPTVVIVQPPTQPQPQPQPMVVEPPPPPPVQAPVQVAAPAPAPVATSATTVPRFVSEGVGIHASVGGVYGGGLRIGGFAAALRLRPSPHFAFDIGAGAYGGKDYYHRDRIEIPINVDVLAYVNPQSRAQFYFVVGAGTSLAFLRDTSSWTDDYDRAYTYLGGQLGGGLELRIGRRLALNIDARVFLRRRIDSSTPEFVDGTRQTNTSAGGLGSLGMTLYL